MIEAYKRELRLMPHILRMEQRGINLDGPTLAVDTDNYWAKLDELDESICEIVGRQVDVDSGRELADAIEAAGLSKGFATTPTGLRSTAKESLIGAIDNPTLLGHLLVRGSIATCLRTFMQPWLVQYNENGRLFMKWNQIRNYTDTGARTGRISSSPNLQNIPVEWEGLKAQLDKIGYAFDDKTLPQVRKYIVPDPGMIFVGRDYSAQEMKLLAHFTNGALLKALQDDPSKDIHLIAAGIAGITRKVAKTLGFAVLYGAGVGRVAETLGIDVGEAKRIKDRYLEALPEIKTFQQELNKIGKTRNYTETLGGRRYYAQKPSVVKGVFKSFEYKLPNYKIQGSAADQTKEAMIRYAESTEYGRLVLSVHDQLVIQCPIENLSIERKHLEYAVNGSFQDVLKYEVRSDESIAFNFAELKTIPENLAELLLKQKDVRFA
jgi:DNA polymerase I